MRTYPLTVSVRVVGSVDRTEAERNRRYKVVVVAIANKGGSSVNVCSPVVVRQYIDASATPSTDVRSCKACAINNNNILTARSASAGVDLVECFIN